MFSRAGYDLFRVALRLAIQLWPVWLFWFAWSLAGGLWDNFVLPNAGDVPGIGRGLATVARVLRPTGALLGPTALFALAVCLHRGQLIGRVALIAAAGAVVLATLLTAWPEWQRLSPYLAHYSVTTVLGAVNDDIRIAVVFGLVVPVIGLCFSSGRRPIGNMQSPGRIRSHSDNHGHADWLPMKDALRLFSGPDPVFGGIIIGEAYRVDQDRVAKLAFDPADKRSWGKGGNAPLLVDPCRTGPTHALVVAFLLTQMYDCTLAFVSTWRGWSFSNAVRRAAGRSRRQRP